MENYNETKPKVYSNVGKSKAEKIKDLENKIFLKREKLKNPNNTEWFNKTISNEIKPLQTLLDQIKGELNWMKEKEIPDTPQSKAKAR